MKLAKEENLKFQYAYTSKKGGLSTCSGVQLKALIGMTTMAMLSSLTPLKKYTRMTCHVQYLLASTTIETQFYFDMHFYAMKPSNFFLFC